MRKGILAIGIVAFVVGCISLMASYVMGTETTTFLGTTVTTPNAYLLYLGIGLLLVGILLVILGVATTKGAPGAEPPPTLPAEEEVDVVKILIRSFKSLMQDPGYLFLYLLPFIVALVAFVHVWLTFGTLTPWMTIRSSADITNLLSSWAMWIVVYGVVAMFLHLVAVAAIISKVGAKERGEGIGLGGALVRGVSRFPSLFAALILGALVIAGPMFLFVGVVLFVPALILPAVLLLLLWIIPALYIAIRLSLYIPACVLEGLGPVACLKRSWEMTKGNFWLIFVTGFLLGIGYAILSQIPQVGILVAMIVIGPAWAIAYALLFLGLKKEQEKSSESL